MRESEGAHKPGGRAFGHTEKERWMEGASQLRLGGGVAIVARASLPTRRPALDEAAAPLEALHSQAG